MKTPRSKPRAAKTGSKPSPWKSLPALASLFDDSTQQPFFKGSKVDHLENLSLTETQLLEQTAALLSLSLPQLIRSGTLVYAKREFLNQKKYLSSSDTDVPLQRAGSGLAGVADSRISAAFETLISSGLAVTPAKLATRATTGYPTALRWLNIHHPELLTPKPEALPLQKSLSNTPKPKRSKTALEPSQPPQRVSTQLKTKKAAKPPRNPDNEPF
jgi:hypothetical protein